MFVEPGQQSELKVYPVKPVSMTFYDSLKDYPYRTTFYVREDAPDEKVLELIRCVSDLTSCVLVEYKIGYKKTVVPDYHEKLKDLSPGVMGTFKWRIKYRNPLAMNRSHTIPGRNRETSLSWTKRIFKRRGKMPDMDHPKWQALLKIMREICITKESWEITGPIEVDITGSDWPPKGAKKKRR